MEKCYNVEQNYLELFLGQRTVNGKVVLVD